MAATKARSAARAIFVLVDLPPNPQSSTIQSGEPSFRSVNRAERSMTRGFGTGYSRRLPRFASFARQHQSSTRPTGIPRGLVSQREHGRWTGRLRKGVM